KPSISVYFDERNSHKGQFQAALQALDAKKTNLEGLKFSFSVDLRYNRRKSHVALLRIGFLMMFRQYGYTYVLHPNLDQVRQQLLNPDQEIIPLPIAVDVPETAQHANSVVWWTPSARPKAGDS